MPRKRTKINIKAMLSAPDDLVFGKHVMQLHGLELLYVQHALHVHDGNKARAARALGIDRRSVYRRIDELRKLGAALRAEANLEPKGETAETAVADDLGLYP